MISRITKITVAVLGILLLFTTGLRMFQNGYRMYVWSAGGEINSNLENVGDSSLVFSMVDEKDFAAPPVPDKGDTILTVNGLPASMDNMMRETSLRPPGSELSLEYKNAAGDTLEATVVTIRVPRSLYYGVLVLFILQVIISAAFLVAGFWAFLRQPDSGAVKALALFCFSMTAVMLTIFNFGHDSMPVLRIPLLQYFMAATGLFIHFTGAFWLNLQLLFPRPRAVVQRHPLLIHSLLYVPIVFVTLMIAINDIVIFEYLLAVLMLVTTIAGFALLIQRNFRPRDLLEKRQTRLVLWGTGTGIFSLLLAIITAMIFRSWFMSHNLVYALGMFIIAFLALFLSPLSFIYAFGRYRLLEVEGRIKRGTRRIAFTIVLLIVFFVILYSLSGFILSKIGTDNRAVIPAFALVLAVGFAPAQRRVQRILEKRLYPERAQLKIMLSDFLSNALAVSDRDTFWNELEERLREVLKVDKVTTVLSAGEDRHMVLRGGEETPFMPEGEFATTLSQFEDRPLMVDEVLASGSIHMTPQVREWLTANDIALALPLTSRGKMIGFLAVGMKSTRQDFETADVEMLRSLSFQVAVAGENLRLLEENIEKQRMENELSMARKVQEGLLPAVMPETPGLEVFGTSLSCLEVAGDYFDVINLDGNRTVLAIGDVSGKGAGAAMLMSNLQASIRTAVRIGSDLKQMIEQINDLIFDNTQAHQFITFFAGIYDRSTREFSYVNAGHNQPLVVKKDGTLSMLECGGLILGAMSEMTYEQESVRLDPGDLLFLYTDGLSEAENPEGDMYDEERVEEFVVRARSLPLGEMVDRLAGEVEEFMNGADRKDDLTLLIARVRDQLDPVEKDDDLQV